MKLQQRTILLTGGTSGIGLEFARQLLDRGNTVIVTGRDAGRIAEARRRLPGLHGIVSDVTDPVSIEALHREVTATFPALDVLVNNAGIMMPPRSLTKQGFESQLGSNHLGHFALTARLYSKLNRSGGRIVNVSSDMHRVGKMDFDDLDGTRSYSPTTAYAQSKLANVLFGLELDRRLRAAHIDVKSVLAHPGYAATNLQSASSTGIARRIMAIGNRALAQSMEMGALDQLYAATSPLIEGGEMIGPDGFQALRGHPRVVTPSAAGRDPIAAKRLWAVSEERTGVRFEIA